VPIEFIGMIATREYSEIHPPQGPVVDVEFTRAFARVHEEAGFDRVLIGYFSNAPDGFVIATDVLAHTERLGVLLAHRPGFVSPTVAARKLATVDQFSGGRLAVHIISGGSDTDQRRDGDYLTHDERYRRTDEYLDILRRVWTEDAPFDHEGEFYRFEGAFSEVRSVHEPYLPIYFGGSSDAALEVAGKHADVYAQWGEPLEQARAQIERVHALAARYGRKPGISLSLRPILGRTEDEAWDRAYRILDQTRGNVAAGGFEKREPGSVGSQRLLEAAAQGDVLDTRLFTPIAKATGAAGNSTSLVGTPEQVAEAMLAYVDIGVTTLLIRGYDPYADAQAYGEVVKLVREEVAHRELSVTH
jgi:alkanesulfonate monooxygenase